MSGYDALAKYLSRHAAPRWQASFADIESVLGRKLPESAYRYPAWWANQSGAGHSQTRGWRGVGWRTTKVNLSERRVVFERERQDSFLDRQKVIDELVTRIRVFGGEQDERAIIAAALKDYAERLAGDALIGLGGTMPDFEAAPRKRWFV